jgi:predicted TIM-barrel fold metal-dependent hydrolase
MTTTDAQVHLWEADRPDRPWPPGAQANLPEPMTAERFIPIMEEAGVDRAVIAPPWVAGFDPTYALECAARYPDRFAVSGRYDLDDPASPSMLPTWLDRPGMKAIRVGLYDPGLTKWRASGALEALLAGAEQYGIPVLIFARDGINGLDSEIGRHPNLRAVIDHLNLVGAPPAEWPARIAELNALARFPNVAVKVSALPAYSQERYPFADLHEPIRQVHAAFGARRLMWGADQTVQMERGSATYSESVNLIREAMARQLPAGDIDWILGKTLAEWLNWPAPLR